MEEQGAFNPRVLGSNPSRSTMRKQCDRCDGDKVMKDEDGNILYEDDGVTPTKCTLCLGKGYVSISYM